MNLESHVQKSTWKVDIVHSTGLQLGRMYKNSHRSAFLYMTLQTGTAAARQRGAAATTEPGPGGSGPKAASAAAVERQRDAKHRSSAAADRSEAEVAMPPVGGSAEGGGG